MKLRNLLEASVNYYIRQAGNFAVALIKGNIPQFLILATDHHSIAGSSNLLFIKINSTKFKNIKFSANSYGRTSAEMLEMHNSVLAFIDRPKALETPHNFNEFLTNLEKHKAWLENFGAIKITKFNNVAELSKMLVVKTSLSPHIIEKLTGVHVDDSVSASHFAGQSELVFPDTLRQAKIDEITALVSAANKILENNGIGIITKCKMFVAPITGNTIGMYYPQTKQIKIDPSARATKQALHTLLHEYGHKWFFEHLSKETINEVKLKFGEVYRETNFRIVSPEKAHQIAQNLTNIKVALSNVKVGDTVEYLGRKKKLKQLSPYTVTEFTPEKLQLTSHASQFVKFSGSPSQFVNADFAVNGVKIETPKTPDGGNTPPDIDLGWFPSQYSKTNYEEWYAEIFAFVLEGRIQEPEIVNFIKNTLR